MINSYQRTFGQWWSLHFHYKLQWVSNMFKFIVLSILLFTFIVVRNEAKFFTTISTVNKITEFWQVRIVFFCTNLYLLLILVFLSAHYLNNCCPVLTLNKIVQLKMWNCLYCELFYYIIITSRKWEKVDVMTLSQNVTMP